MDRIRWRRDASTTVPNALGGIDAWGVATRVGVFQYADGSGVLREYVSAEELFDGASISTLRGVPFTVQHPDGDVTIDNARDLVHGWILDVRSDQAAGTVETLVRIASSDALAAIESGTVELSCGYETVVKPIAGVSPQGEAYDAVQTQRRYNHLALVDVARVGHVARLRLDGVQQFDDDDDEDAMKTVKIKLADGRTIDVPEILVPAWKSAALPEGKRKDAGLNPTEVVIGGEKLMLPQSIVEQLLALLGASPDTSTPPAEDDPAAEADPATMPDAATSRVQAGKSKGLDAADVQAIVSQQVNAQVSAHLAKADSDRRVDGEVRAAAGKILPRSYGFGGTTWRIAADAIAHADEARSGAADALVVLADKGDARAQGRLLGMLEAIARLADGEAENEDAPVYKFARDVAHARGDGAVARVDSSTEARNQMRRRKLHPTAAAASK